MCPTFHYGEQFKYSFMCICSKFFLAVFVSLQLKIIFSFTFHFRLRLQSLFFCVVAPYASTSTLVWTGWSQCTRSVWMVSWLTRWALARRSWPSLCWLIWHARKAAGALILLLSPQVSCSIGKWSSRNGVRVSRYWPTTVTRRKENSKER